MIKRILLSLIAVFATVTGVYADPDKHADHCKWMQEMNKTRREFITRELNLSKTQQARFFTHYEAMDAEIRSLYDNLDKKGKAIEKKGAKATDAECLALSKDMFDAKAKEGIIEQKYYKKFKEILSPKQLVKLKKAERDFHRKMAKEHRKLHQKK